MKEGTILTQKGEFGLEDLTEINRYTRRELTAAEVYAFPLVLCDNEIDRDQEAFTKEALETLAGLFLGKTGLFDHQHTTLHQTARIYHTQVVEHPDRITRCGETYCTLNAKAYLVRCPETEGLILSIDGGIRKEVSVSCQVARRTCSICGKEAGSCSHQPGQEYGGRICCIRLEHPADAYEWSFVAVPAQREAGVTKQCSQSAPIRLAGNTPQELLKGFTSSEDVALSLSQQRVLKEYLSQLEQSAQLGKEYLLKKKKEVRRLAFLADPELDGTLMEEISKQLTLDQCRALCKVYRRRLEGKAKRQLVPDKKQQAKEQNRFFKI